MYLYQENNRYFAQISGGMETLGAEELAELGAKNIDPVQRGISFEADKATLYRINYTARLITRVMAPLAKFNCFHPDQLYKKARTIQWHQLITLDNTFAIFSNVSRSKITNSQYAGLRLKDAIADSCRQALGKRPNVDSENPDIWINLHIHQNEAIINFETSGGSLHKRGYRKNKVRTPMQETLAAAIIRLAGWDGSQPIYDPMCGSGTLLSEALMVYCRVPAGYLRQKFCFEYLPDFDSKIWDQVKMEADRQIRELPKELISGSDISSIALAAARNNNRNLPSGRQIKWYVRDFQEIDQLENTIIVCNPPYGIRSGEKEKVQELYLAFGDFLKQRCNGSTAYIYCGDKELMWQLRLKPEWQKNLTNGGIKGVLMKFNIY